MKNLTVENYKLLIARFQGVYTTPSPKGVSKTKVSNAKSLLAQRGFILGPDFSGVLIHHDEYQAIADAVYLTGVAAGAFRKASGKLVLGRVTDEDIQKSLDSLVKTSVAFGDEELALVKLALYLGAKVNGTSKSRANNATLAVLVDGYDFEAIRPTVRDVMRLAVAMCGGDTQLRESTRFKLTRSQRRTLVEILERVLGRLGAEATLDFSADQEAWKRLFFAIHPSDFPKAKLVRRAAKIVNSGNLPGRNCGIESAISSSNVDAVVDHLSDSPGEFARRLAELIRKMPADRNRIVDAFAAVASKVSPRVLVQARNHFTSPDRNILPTVKMVGASRTVRSGYRENPLDGSYADVVEAIEGGLADRMDGVKVKLVGNLDADVAVMPTSGRIDAQAGVGTNAGKWLPIDTGMDNLVVFIHWRNHASGRAVDLDLSTAFLDEQFNTTRVVTWNRSASDEVAAYSGDVTNAPNGADEYIVLNVANALKSGARYLNMTVNSYNGGPIGRVPEAYFGVAAKEGFALNFDSSRDELIFRTPFTTDRTATIPAVIDLKNLAIMILGEAVDGMISGGGYLNTGVFQTALQTAALSKKTSVDDYLMLTGATITEGDDFDLELDASSVEQLAALFD